LFDEPKEVVAAEGQVVDLGFRGEESGRRGAEVLL
jgi:hypothetical protein